MRNTLIIKEPNPFYSALDEEHFFTWLESIPVVKSAVGTKYGLEITMDGSLDEPNLRDLIAVMHRYGVNKKCLAAYVTPKNEKWFKNPVAYWYDSIFL